MAVHRHQESHIAVLAADPPPPRPGNLDGRRPQRRRSTGLAGLLARWTPLAEDEILGLAAVVAPGAVCVDVGANYGLYTNALSWLAGHSGAVHSVEPLPGAFRVLSASSALAGAGNVRRHRLALSDTIGTSTLSLPIRHGLPVHGRAFLTAGANGNGANSEFRRMRAVEVEVSTLDDLCARQEITRVDFLKADVEGAELAVLRGARWTVDAHRPVLLLEIDERHTRKYGHGGRDVVGWLAERGYRMHRWAGDRWQWTAVPHSGVRNYLFVSA